MLELLFVLALIGLAIVRFSEWLYLQASQNFSRLTPGFVGAIRRVLFRLSDNYDFLGEKDPHRQRRENSVY